MGQKISVHHRVRKKQGKHYASISVHATGMTRS